MGEKVSNIGRYLVFNEKRRKKYLKLNGSQIPTHPSNISSHNCVKVKKIGTYINFLLHFYNSKESHTDNDSNYLLIYIPGRIHFCK